MRNLLILGVIATFILSSCSTSGRSCKGAKEKWSYYNGLQFGKAPSKTIKKRR